MSMSWSRTLLCRCTCVAAAHGLRCLRASGQTGAHKTRDSRAVLPQPQTSKLAIVFRVAAGNRV